MISIRETTNQEGGADGICDQEHIRLLRGCVI